jgi:hypothetical protein
MLSSVRVVASWGYSGVIVGDGKNDLIFCRNKTKKPPRLIGGFSGKLDGFS